MKIAYSRAASTGRSWRNALSILAGALLALSLVAGANAQSRSERQADAREGARQTLARLYEVQPAARNAVTKAAGYAVFTDFGLKLFIAGGGKGSGVAVNNKTKKETFMRMLQVQAGLGFGIQKFRMVWVFETQQAFDSFVNTGWEFGAQATAAVRGDGQGAFAAGALSVSPGVWVYQLTEDGLALELSATGTKYFRDDELN